MISLLVTTYLHKNSTIALLPFNFLLPDLPARRRGVAKTAPMANTPDIADLISRNNIYDTRPATLSETLTDLGRRRRDQPKTEITKKILTVPVKPACDEVMDRFYTKSIFNII